MARVRVNTTSSLYDVEIGMYRNPKPGEYFDADDPFVLQHKWAFSTDEELQAKAEEDAPDSVLIEAVTAAPGERRATRRK